MLTQIDQRICYVYGLPLLRIGSISGPSTYSEYSANVHIHITKCVYFYYEITKYNLYLSGWIQQKK